MAAGDHKVAYAASASVTVTNLNALATSSTWVAGRALPEQSNTTDLAFDRMYGGRIRVGTTPTANTIIEVWVIPKIDDSTWPDVFDGSDAARTTTTRAILLNYAGLGASLAVDTNTSNRDYWFLFSALEALKTPTLPKSMQLFITHNTGVNLNATPQGISHWAVYDTIAAS